tara:strand:- start:15 stop:1682 length:1668 start_codon:yes stop_codon:yes gene_type:complete
MKWIINGGTGELEPINSAKFNLGQRFNLGGLAGRVGFKDGPQILPENYIDQRTRKNLDTDLWEKRVQKTIDGKKTRKWISQTSNETKPQFFKRIEDLASTQIKKSNLKQIKETIKGQSYIDKWTSNWLNNNIDTYKLKQSDNLVKDLSKAWQAHLKKVEIPKGFKQKLSTFDGLPNVTYGGSKRIPFTYEGFKVYAGGKTDRLSGQIKKMFFKNKIRTIPNLKKDLTAYFDFINMDKRGMYNQFSGKTIQAFRDIVNKDVIYLLSPDAKFTGASKYEVFNSFDDKFNNAYNTYAEKVNKSKQWVKNANFIEKKLGLKKNSIINSMNREQRHLKKIFDVNNLPVELRYSVDHAQGVSAAAQSGDKKIMQRAVKDLIGTTVRQNQSLGWYGGGFEAQRNALMREIVAGRNVKSNIGSLNQLAKKAYTDLGLKGNMYSLKGGKLTSQPVSKAVTEASRFKEYLKTIAKTKEGAAEIKKQGGIKKITQLLPKQIAKRIPGKSPLLALMAANQMMFGRKFDELWGFPLTPARDVEQIEELGTMITDKFNYFDGGIASLKK